MFPLPPQWYATRQPRRGSPKIPPIALRTDVTVELNWKGKERLADVEVDDATPYGAAVIAVAAQAGIQGHPGAAIADFWITTHGLRFAAEAVVELSTLHVYGHDGARGVTRREVGGPLRPFYDGYQNWLAIALRVRTVLAVASDAEYAEVSAVLAGYRGRGSHERLATSVLVPTEIDWVLQDCTEVDGPPPSFLWYSVSTQEQAEKLLPAAVREWAPDYDRRLLTTLVEGLGGLAADPLTRLGIAGEVHWRTGCAILPFVTEIPADEALIALITHRPIGPELLAAAARFPDRALRVYQLYPDHPVIPELLRTLRLKGKLDEESLPPVPDPAYVISVLAASKPDAPHPALAGIQQATDLADFGWALFVRWLYAGTPLKQRWTLDALAWTADDRTVRRLTPLILAWPAEHGHARAVRAVEVLARIGTDAAVAELDRIATTTRHKGLKAAAIRARSAARSAP